MLKESSNNNNKNIFSKTNGIAKEKMKDLNAFDLKEATKIICGSARSMGIEVKE